MLHRPRYPVRSAVVTKRGTLALDTGLERPPEPAVKRPQLTSVEVTRGACRAEPGAPESFVRIDVSDAGHGSLIE
jgi:hypothetical protein